MNNMMRGMTAMLLLAACAPAAAQTTPKTTPNTTPKAAAPMVEAHGVFDKGTGVVDTSGYGTIQARDGATIATIGKAVTDVIPTMYARR